MKFTVAYLAAVVAPILAHPDLAVREPLKPSKWMPKGEDEVRSPCPGLNALANHGWLPRDGKHMTLPRLTKAFKKALNVGADFADFAGTAGAKLGDGETFDLNDLNVHNEIEHDASLTRQDAYFGDFHTFNRTVYDGTEMYFKGKQIDVTKMAEARYARVKDSMKRNPEFGLSKFGKEAGFTEGALIVSVFGNPDTGVVENPEWVRYFMLNRRLPYELGWTPRKKEINLTTLGKLMNKIRKATPKDGKGPDAEAKLLVH